MYVLSVVFITCAAGSSWHYGGKSTLFSGGTCEGSVNVSGGQFGRAAVAIANSNNETSITGSKEVGALSCMNERPTKAS